jgi:hypothetical protein
MTTTGRHFLPLVYGINVAHSADIPRARRKTHRCKDKVNVIFMIPAPLLRPSVSFHNSTSPPLPSVPSLFSYLYFTLHKNLTGGTRWRSWFKHCATSQKVADSFPDGVHNPSGRTVALRSTQPLREMSTRYISWGVKVAGA